MNGIGQKFSDFMNEQGLYEEAQDLASEKYKTNKSNVKNSLTPELKKNLSKLDEIKSLKKNWNGNGAKPITKKVINKTKLLIRKLEKQPQIFPTADDSIQIEYDGEDNSYLELQITNKVIISYFKVDKIGNETAGEIPFSSLCVNALIKEFTES